MSKRAHRANPDRAGRRWLPASPLSRLVAALAVAALLGSSWALGSSRPATAGPAVSQSAGRFLGGSVLGAGLAGLLSVDQAAATNTGGPDVTQADPLGVSALNAVDVSLGGGVNLLGGNGILALGALGQYATAAADGSSAAASGAIGGDGAIAVGGTPAAPANASLSLRRLIGASLAGSLTDLSLTTGALSASATQTAAGAQSGGYQIASLDLSLTSPLVAALAAQLRASLVALQPVVDALPATLRALPAIGPLAAVSGLPNLATLAGTLGQLSTADGSITADLGTGAVTIDAARVLSTAGLDLNALPADTDLLPYLSSALSSQLVPALASTLAALNTAIATAIGGIGVTVLGIAVPSAVLAPVLAPVTAQLSAPITEATATLSGAVAVPLASALSSMLALHANLRSVSAGAFTETALLLGLLPAAPTPVAALELASASVGPNAGPALPQPPTAAGLTPNSGPVAGGQTVTVTGANFVPGATSVSIGGNTVPAAAVTVVSASSLRFSTPAHAAGPVGVSVSTPAGTSTPPLAYTYLTAGASASSSPSASSGSSASSGPSASATASSGPSGAGDPSGPGDPSGGSSSVPVAASTPGLAFTGANLLNLLALALGLLGTGALASASARRRYPAAHGSR